MHNQHYRHNQVNASNSEVTPFLLYTYNDYNDGIKLQLFFFRYDTKGSCLYFFNRCSPKE